MVYNLELMPACSCSSSGEGKDILNKILRRLVCAHRRPRSSVIRPRRVCRTIEPLESRRLLSTAGVPTAHFRAMRTRDMMPSASDETQSIVDRRARTARRADVGHRGTLARIEPRRRRGCHLSGFPPGRADGAGARVFAMMHGKRMATTKANLQGQYHLAMSSGIGLDPVQVIAKGGRGARAAASTTVMARRRHHRLEPGRHRCSPRRSGEGRGLYP